VGDVAAALCEFEPEVAGLELSARLDRGNARSKARAVDLAAALVDRAGWPCDELETTAAELRALLHARALAAAAALPLVLRAASAAEPEVRARAAAAAAALPRRSDLDEPAAALLLSLLADPDASVREAALRAIGERKLAPQEVVPRLAALPSDGPPAVVAAGARELSKALSAAASAGVAAGPARFTADDLIELCALPSEFDLHGFALRDSELELLLEAASGGDPLRARLAARALPRHDGPLSPAAAARLVDALASGPDFLRAAAAALLDERCSQTKLAVPALVRALGGEKEVADAAARSLPAHGALAVRALAAALSDGSHVRRLRVVSVLAAMSGAARPAVPALLECAASAEPVLAAAASEALLSIFGIAR
jgi:hypothetical protein